MVAPKLVFARCSVLSPQSLQDNSDLEKLKPMPKFHRKANSSVKQLSVPQI